MRSVPKDIKPAVILIGLVVWSLVNIFIELIPLPVYFLVSIIWLIAGHLWYRFNS
ncbi:MAG: hypothetical protein PVI06_04960 [Desulfobacterales bacterium]